MRSEDHRCVVASGNAGKLREIASILKPFGIEALPQADFGVDDVEETGLTFVENALIKARHACERTGLPALADDSGIEVDALNGEPGIFSARYAGEHGNDAANNARLLRELQGVDTAGRTAAFRCVMVYLRHTRDPAPLIAEGVWYGRILEEETGDGGFGYDPLFFACDEKCCAALMSSVQKNAVSHRGQALRELTKKLQLRIAR